MEQPSPVLDRPDTDTDLDLDFLIALDNFNAPHCESRHISERNKVCTHQPVARGTTCQMRYVMVCAAHVKFWMWCFETHRTCEGCHKLAADCWQLHPLNLSS